LWYGLVFNNVAVGVITVRRHAESDGAFINLVVTHEFFRKLRAATQNDDEQTRRVRIERPTVADFFDAEFSANGVHHIV
jgi:hypothetical protein